MDLWPSRDKTVPDAILFVDKPDQRPVNDLAELVDLTGLRSRKIQRSTAQLEALFERAGKMPELGAPASVIEQPCGALKAAAAMADTSGPSE